jgi:hypothetical protein
MKIRSPTKSDIPAMTELLRQLFSVEADFTPDADKQFRGLEKQNPGFPIPEIPFGEFV